MRAWVLMAVVLGLPALAGCSGGAAGTDAGLARGDGGGVDSGGSPADAGPPAVATATWTVSGASSASRAHNGDDNYVTCTRTPSGLLDMTSAETAGGYPTITVRIDDYRGPGTFDFTYGTGARATADIRLTGGFSYWYFYDYSTIDFVDIPSTCSMTISEPVPGMRLQATISCARLVANITSPNYDDRDAAGYRPYVSLTATFDCDI